MVLWEANSPGEDIFGSRDWVSSDRGDRFCPSKKLKIPQPPTSCPTNSYSLKYVPSYQLKMCYLTVSRILKPSTTRGHQSRTISGLQIVLIVLVILIALSRSYLYNTKVLLGVLHAVVAFNGLLKMLSFCSRCLSVGCWTVDTVDTGSCVAVVEAGCCCCYPTLCYNLLCAGRSRFCHWYFSPNFVSWSNTR